ncbi:MAG: hypothetical protein NXI22_24330 [bacterium]|nr:hypothetical protein [bacterium]
MSKTRKFITAIIIETLAVVAIFYALGVARDNSLTAEDADAQSTEIEIQQPAETQVHQSSGWPERAGFEPMRSRY